MIDWIPPELVSWVFLGTVLVGAILLALICYLVFSRIEETDSDKKSRAEINKKLDDILNVLTNGSIKSVKKDQQGDNKEQGG